VLTNSTQRLSVAWTSAQGSVLLLKLTQREQAAVRFAYATSGFGFDTRL
jgi:hypothetical protein